MVEREALYIKWEVTLEGKHRKLKFINKLWTDPHDARHVQESSEIVANLVDFRQVAVYDMLESLITSSSCLPYNYLSILCLLHEI